MSYTLTLEINLTELTNNQKGTFFSEVSRFISKQDFQQFRKAVSKCAEVYTVLDFEYNKMINLRKIIKLLSNQTRKFTINMETEEEKRTISLFEFEKMIEAFKVIHKLPYFKYHPYVYEGERISYYKDRCEVCNQESVFFHEGFYGESDLEAICVHCIASGKAGEEHDILFNDQHPTSFEDAHKVEELHLRTPSILSWQEIPWLEHCKDFCAYVGTVNWEEISHLEQELHNDLIIEATNYHLEQDEFKQALNNYILGHIFKCLHCGKHRLTTDLP